MFKMIGTRKIKKVFIFLSFSIIEFLSFLIQKIVSKIKKIKWYGNTKISTIHATSFQNNKNIRSIIGIDKSIFVI